MSLEKNIYVLDIKVFSDQPLEADRLLKKNLLDQLLK